MRFISDWSLAGLRGEAGAMGLPSSSTTIVLSSSDEGSSSLSLSVNLPFSISESVSDS